MPPLPLLQSILRDKLTPESDENGKRHHNVNKSGSLNVLSEIQDSPKDMNALNGTRKANFKKYMENETTERKQKFDEKQEKENSPVNSLN